MKAILIIAGIVIATVGGVIAYRALYLEPRSVVIITESKIRELPNYWRVAGGAALLVGGAALAFSVAIRKAR